MMPAILSEPVIVSEAKDLLLIFSAFAPALRAVLTATLVIGVAGMAATIAWRASASIRHALWLLALTASLVVAIVAATGADIVFETNTVVNGPDVVPFHREVLPPRETLAPADLRVSPPPVSPRVSLVDSIRDNSMAIAVAIWIVGFLTILVRCVAGHVGIARLVARARASDGDQQASIERATRQAGLDGRVVVKMSDEIDAPFTIGAWSPVVLLPAAASDWSRERLHIVLVHELAHVARLDYVAQLVATAACAIYWFNPIVWLAGARLRSEAEQAADDRVLAAGVDGVTYASHLLELARPESIGPASTAVAVGMAHTNRLERRFKAMLDSTRSRGTVPLRLQAVAAAAVVVMAVPLVGFRMIPAQQVATKTVTNEVTQAAPDQRTVSHKTSKTYAVSTPTAAAISSPTIAAVSSPTAVTAAEVTLPSTETTPAAFVADTVIEKTLSASAGERISLDLRTGGEVIVRAWEQPQVRVRASLSGDQSRQTSVEMQRGSGGIEFRAVAGYRSGNTSNSNRFELWVPRRFDVHVSSSGGGIDISGVQGRFTGRTGGGEILFDNVQGVADITTGGGEVHVSNSNLDGRISTGGGEATVVGVSGNVRVTSGSGPVVRAGQATKSVSVGGSATISSSQSASVIGDRAYSGSYVMSRAGGEINVENVPDGAVMSTGGGDITIGSSAGKLSVTTGGGDIGIRRMGGDVDATTGAGDVHITVVNTDGTSHNVVVHSGSGVITIDLPADIDARFDLETAYTERNGPTNIKSDFPVQVTETQEWDGRNGTPRRYVRATGTAGAGRGLIRLRTVNGDVIIRRR